MNAAIRNAFGQLIANDYAGYLRSSHWRYLRERALGCAGHRCQRCGAIDKRSHATVMRFLSAIARREGPRIADRLEVHHRHYRTLGREEFEDLEVLCEECHAAAHERGEWRDDGPRRAGYEETARWIRRNRL